MRRLPSADTTPEGGARFFDTFISPRYSLTSAGIITASINSRSAAGISSPPGRPFRSNLRTSAISFEITVADQAATRVRSEEHTSELQSRGHLVCRLLLE